MITDAGYIAAGVTGAFPPAQEAIGFLRRSDVHRVSVDPGFHLFLPQMRMSHDADRRARVGG